MIFPPLFKYLNLEGAKLTLGNGTFRHAKPSEFNDDMDMTILNLFPMEVEVALEDIGRTFQQVLLDNLDKPATCLSPRLRKMVTVLQSVYFNNPEAIELIKAETKNDKVADLYDLDHIRDFAEQEVAEINVFLQGYRVFCVADNNTTLSMWENYAGNHTGIVLRITPNLRKDSKFRLFRKVNYVSHRPTLFENPRGFLEDGLFGNQEEVHQAILDKIIYTKTIEWAHEQEYRLVVPILKEEDWDTLPYYLEEISEMYLGTNMSEDDKYEIFNLALSRNPAIEIYESCLSGAGELQFKQLK